MPGGAAEASERVEPSASGAVIAATKLQVPPARSRLVPRARLVERLTAGTAARLVLIQAPLGFGKTTLLVGWHEAAAKERPFAWLSLDRSDNDPVRFVEGVIAALQVLDSRIGVEALVRLGGGSGLTDVVLPLLVNDVVRLSSALVLVLDDYHVIESPRVHKAVGYVLDHQPPGLQLALSTRSTPPLPLGRLRVRRELLEVRAADLRFTDEEAAALLDITAGIGLEASDVAPLQDRTEGWAAGLQLAALMLSGRPRPSEFVSSFAGDDRPVVDYLGFEVLDGQPPEIRDFLLSTSILDRLCGSLCDHLTGGDGSARRLGELERGGLPLMPLDAKGNWYRYHPLFAELLRHELTRTRPDSVPGLHRRASAWHRDAGSIDEAVHYAIAGDDLAMATGLITEHWYAFLQRGRIETVAGWLDALGDDVVGGQPALCLTKAWIAVNTGRLEDVARWIEAAERTGDSEARVRSGVASLHEIHEYMCGDVERAVEAGRRSVEQGDTPWRPVGCPVLGLALFWSGRSGEADAELASSVETARAAENHLAVIHASAGVAAIRAHEGDLGAADATASAALRLADERGLSDHWATTMARVIHGRALEQRGRIDEAGEEIDRGVELSEHGVATVEIAYARLAQAESRQLHADREGAWDAVRHARRALDGCAAPGILTEMLARTERRLRLVPRGVAAEGPGNGLELTERELSVLRLLPGELSQREIGEALFVSVNTVKSHTRSMYRKLRVATRDEAVARARSMGLL